MLAGWIQSRGPQHLAGPTTRTRAIEVRIVRFVVEPSLTLNLGQFDTPTGAKAMIRKERAFDNEALSALNRAVGLTVLSLFVMSADSRARGLYEGIVREVEHDNPHAVFPMLRQLAETVAMSFYVADHPTYADVLIEREKDKPSGVKRRKGIQALVSHVDKHHARQFGKFYAELSEMAHFGKVAMWTPHRVEPDTGRMSWSSVPAWKDDRQLYVACAQLLELGDAMSQAILCLGDALEADPFPVLTS